MKIGFVRRDAAWWTNGVYTKRRIEVRATLWDELFQTDYRTFRAQLHRLQRSARWGFDCFFDTHDRDPDLMELLRIPGHLVFPIDEDDWYCAGIATHPFNEGKFNRWCYCELVRGQFKLYPEPIDKLYYAYQTNNYAAPTPVAPESLVDGIRPANELVSGAVLSVHNKSIASLSLPWRTKTELSLELEVSIEALRQLTMPAGVPAEFGELAAELLDLYLGLWPRYL